MPDGSPAYGYTQAVAVLPPTWSDRHSDLVLKGNYILSERGPLLSFWQEIADNFYPERAQFTVSQSITGDFAEGLSTSYPLIVRRDLGNTVSTFLRPEGQEWGEITTNKPIEKVDGAGRLWTESASKITRKAMYDESAKFARATAAGDQDWAAFGQCVISCEINWRKVCLLYRTWHMKDMAWCENSDGDICFIVRDWECPAKDLVRIFGEDRVHPVVKALVNEQNGINSYRKIRVRHHMIMAGDYDMGTPAGSRPGLPWVSVWLDMENRHVMEETGRRTSYYMIPRWVLVDGNPYAFSPAVTAGLPDARLLQAQAYTLLRAGQMYVDPPRVAIMEAFRGDLSLYPGSISWLDAAYEGKVDEALHTISQDKTSMPVGFNMSEMTMAMLRESFYISKLQLPNTKEMTAEEARFRVAEYVRQAAPLFAPMQTEYNGQIWDHTFVNLRSVNAYGEIPESLQGSQVDFKFKSPILQAEEQQLPRIMMDSIGLAQAAGQMDPAAAHMLNAQAALRDALRGAGAPQPWIASEDEMEQATADTHQQMATEQAAAQVAGAANVAEQVGNAGQSLAAAAQPAAAPAQ